MPSLEGRAILLTGAAGGIGAAAARELDRRGARLALVDLHAEPLEHLAGGLRHAVPLPADVTDAPSVERAVAAAVDRLGGLDCAIANAGIGPIGSVEALDPALFERTIQVNLLGAYRTLRLSLPHVRARKGYLLAVASLAAPVHSPLMAHYAASKAGVEAFANALRTEVVHEGVDVGIAYFGWIATGMVRAGMEDPGAAMLRRRSLPPPMRRDLPPEGAARAVARGIERRARVVAYPRWVRLLLAARGLVQPLTELQLRRSGMGAEAVRASAGLRAGDRGDNVGRTMRVIDCDCGVTLQAANDDDLVGRVREHLESDHPDKQMGDDELRGFVSEQAYSATDS